MSSIQYTHVAVNSAPNMASPNTMCRLICTFTFVWKVLFLAALEDLTNIFDCRVAHCWIILAAWQQGWASLLLLSKVPR